VDDQLVREIVRRSEAHFPEEMVDREVADRTRNLLQALERRGATLDDYLEAEKKDLSGFQEEMRGEARESIITTLVLLDLARENQVFVTEGDVEDEVKRRAESENVKLSQMRRLLNDTGEMAQIRNRIFFRKIADFLRSKAEIKEVEA
jgi:trigger factor